MELKVLLALAEFKQVTLGIHSMELKDVLFETPLP